MGASGERRLAGDAHPPQQPLEVRPPGERLEEAFGRAAIGPSRPGQLDDAEAGALGEKVSADVERGQAGVDLAAQALLARRAYAREVPLEGARKLGPPRESALPEGRGIHGDDERVPERAARQQV